jgi:hypothetical protein
MTTGAQTEARAIIAPWIHPFGITPEEEDEIVRAIATALAAKDAELTTMKVQLDCALIREGNEKHRAKIAHQNMNAEINARERAEAQLVGAWNAFGPPGRNPLAETASEVYEMFACADGDIAAQIRCLEAQLAEAIKALEPFARIADAEDFVGTKDGESIFVNVNLCRAARRARETQGEE